MTWLPSLLTASLMLTTAAIAMGFVLRCLQSLSPKMQQLLILGALLQGLMLIRIPVPIPVLHSTARSHGKEPLQVDSTSTSLRGSEWLPELQHLEQSTGSADPTLGQTVITPFQEHFHWSEVAWAEVATVLVLSMWMIGLVLIVARTVLRYVFLCRQINALSPAPKDWDQAWKSACQTIDRKAPPMLVSDALGPMLARRPSGYVLIVPRDYWRNLSDEERGGVLLHERAHLLRHDIWRQLLVRLVAAAHWWNPAAWWCVRRYEECTEWVCDGMLRQASVDFDASRGLATSLVKLVEFTDAHSANQSVHYRGLGVQSMAAPPLTQRVTRLLSSPSAGDSLMKRSLFGCSIAALLVLSTIQFNLVAAPPFEEQRQIELEIEVIPPHLQTAVDQLKKTTRHE